MISLLEFQEKNIDVFIKNFISTKVRPNSHLIEACHPFICELDEKDIKNKILPAIQKAMLRNPEVIIETVGLILNSLSPDLSMIALDVSKTLIG